MYIILKVYFYFINEYVIVVSEVSERRGLPDLVIGTMYSSTTPREVTVVDGVN